jgi:hypothetical protein
MLQETRTGQEVKIDKSKYVKGIVINVYEQSVSEHLFKRKKDSSIDLKEVYEVIDCEMVERVPLNRCGFFDESHDLLIDEEGLFKPTPGFLLGLNVYLGNAVIFGVDWDNGRWENADIQVSAIIEKITWLDTQTANSIAQKVL